MLKRTILFVVLMMLSIQFAQSAEFKTLQRKYVPIKMAGARITVSQFAFNDWRAFRYDASDGSWHLVPFQVDYRDANGNYHGKPAPTYLDANDEVLFMPEDLGDRAPEKAWLAENGIRAARRVEIEISEGSDATQKGWLYLYPSSSQPKSYFRHIGAPKGSGADTVFSNAYIIGHNYHGWIDYLAMADNPKTDLIDRLKLRVAGTALDPTIGKYAATEDTLKGNGSIPGSKDSTYTYWPGVVRAIRDQRSKLTVPGIGTAPIDYPLFYYPWSVMIGVKDKQLESEYILVLAGAKLIRQSLDLSPQAAGMRFYSDNNRGGAAIDGTAENIATALASQTGKQWTMASGPQGTLFVVMEMPSTKNGATILYYRDDRSGGTSDNTLESGDKKSYGDMGLVVTAKSGSGLITNNVTMGFTLYILPERDRDATFADAFFKWIQQDPAVKVSVLNDPGTRVDIPASVPDGFKLGAGYPNPFDPHRGEIAWEITAMPVAQDYEVQVFNLLGQLVTSWRSISAPVNGRTLLRWDGRDAKGYLAPQGVYFVRVHCAGQMLMTKVQVVY